MQPFLSLPAVQYKNSFISAVKEFQQAKTEAYKDIKVEELEADFPAYVQAELDKAKGIGILPHQVPYTIYWLIIENQVVGRLRLRHFANDYLLDYTGHIGYNIRPSFRRKGWGKLILKLGLEKAKQRDLKKVLIICKSHNIGSQKVIEANGGKLFKKKKAADDQVERLYYWIDLVS